MLGNWWDVRKKERKKERQTLGPAGPPLQRGVLVVPQSAQVLRCVPSDETLSGVVVWLLLLLIILLLSSDSETCS